MQHQRRRHQLRDRPRRREHAGVVQLVDDARRTTVSDSEAPLQQRDAGLLLAADDLDALLDEILVLAAARLAIRVCKVALGHLVAEHLSGLLEELEGEGVGAMPSSA